MGLILVVLFCSGVTVAPFGSFASGIHSCGSDVDISLEVALDSPFAIQLNDDPTLSNIARKRRDVLYKQAKVKVLRKMFNLMRQLHYRDVQLIATANVPLIKFVDVQVTHATRPVPCT